MTLEEFKDLLDEALSFYDSEHSGTQIDEGITCGLGAVRYDVAQVLAEAQKAQARVNIGASTTGAMAVYGFYETLEKLEENVTSPKLNGLYGVGSTAPYKYYQYDFAHSEWKDMGTLEGPPGPQGPPGPPGSNIIQNGAITRDMLAADAVTKTYTATLLSSAWTRITPANGYYYHQDISDLPVMGKFIMDVDLSGFVATAADAVMAQTVEEEYGYIYLAIFTRAGVLRVFSRELPTVDIPLKFMGVYR